MLNKFILQGRLVKEAEIKIFNSGKEYCNFSIAVQRSFKNKEGEYDTDFFNCKAFGGSAKLVANYFNKGDMILIEGRIQNDKVGDKTFTNVVVESVNFCGGGSEKKEVSSDNIPF